MFFRQSFTRSARGMTARDTTKSNFAFTSSARAHWVVTFFRPSAPVTSLHTNIFFRVLSTR